MTLPLPVRPGPVLSGRDPSGSELGPVQSAVGLHVVSGAPLSRHLLYDCLSTTQFT